MRTNSNSRRKDILSILLLSLLVYPMVGGLDALADEPVSIEVPANRVAVPSKIFVQRGDRVTIDASGEWSLDGEDFFGPDGSDETADSSYHLPGAPAGSLNGRIGLQGKDFTVGSHFSKKVKTAGMLFLGINNEKALGTYRDNRGTLTVRVTIEKTAASVDGNYRFKFLENEVKVIVNGESIPIKYDDLAGRPFKVKEGEIVLNEEMTEKIKNVPGFARVRIEGINIFIDNPDDPNAKELKGLYDIHKRKFSIGGAGAIPIGRSGQHALFAINVLKGNFKGKGRNIRVKGDITMTVIVGGRRGAGALSIVLPFKGRKI